jgi:small ligand-binding sensory domain FIST
MTGVATSLAFAAGHGGGVDWRGAVDETLARLGPVPPGSNLGVVYVSDSLIAEMPVIVQALRQETGIAHWVGCVGMGVLGVSVATSGPAAYTGIADEYFGVPALSVLAIRLPPEAFRLIPGQHGEETELGADGDNWLAVSQPAIGLVHADPRHQYLSELIGDLAERTGYLIGGLSSAQGPMPVIADDIEEGVASGVLFAPGLGISTSLTQGCTPIGPARSVTRVHQNMLVELDGESALAALYADIGSDKIEDLRAAANSLHAALPVPGSDRSDYMVRNLTGIDLAQGMVGIAATPDPGDKVMFCRRDADAARKDLEQMASDLAKRLDNPPKGGIYISCLARGPNLFDRNEELSIIRQCLGDFPIAGFYANGEIAGNRIYGYTGVLTVFA